jgi:pilus assembly protein CpaB
MRRGRILIFVVLILIIGLVVAAVAIRQFLLANSTPETPAESFVTVYIARQNIPQGADITEDVLSTAEIPRGNLIDTMYTVEETAALITEKVAKYPLDQGTFITESMVVDKASAASLIGTAMIPEGMTAISIPTSRLSLVSYGVGDGSRVNVTACFWFVDIDTTFQTMLPNLTSTLTGTGFGPDALPILSLGVGGAGAQQGRLELEPALQQPYYLLPSEVQRPRMVCQMLLQDVAVLKRGNFVEFAPPPDDGNPETPPAQTIPDVVTLIVAPQDSVTLTYLTYTNTRLTLTLRNPTDRGRQATEASTLAFLLSQYNIPVPAKLPYSLQVPSMTDGAAAPSLPSVGPLLPNGN